MDRLIDVDKLIDDLKHSKNISIAERMKFSNIVEHQPIITFPVAKLDTTDCFAEWIDVNGDGSIMKCSKCGEEVCCKDNNFCSNCGADMRPKILDQAIDGAGKDGNVKEENPCPCMECFHHGTYCMTDYCNSYLAWKAGEPE